MYVVPGKGQKAPQGTKFWCQQKGLITLLICCKFQRTLFEVWFYIFLVTSVIYCQFQIIDDNSFRQIHCYTFCPYKSITDQIWPCRKIGQGQPRVIIWAKIVELKHPMMHTKIQGHWPFGSREEAFFRLLPYMAMTAILVIWPGPFEQTFVSPSHRSAIWNLIWLPSGF